MGCLYKDEIRKEEKEKVVIFLMLVVFLVND